MHLILRASARQAHTQRKNYDVDGTGTCAIDGDAVEENDYEMGVACQASVLMADDKAQT